MGGEKMVLQSYAVYITGSPPRGRGKVDIRDILFVGGGITPAWAGKSPRLEKFFISVKDHPRVGGEKLFHAGSGLVVLGSPPRGRGKVCADLK